MAERLKARYVALVVVALAAAGFALAQEPPRRDPPSASGGQAGEKVPPEELRRELRQIVDDLRKTARVLGAEFFPIEDPAGDLLISPGFREGYGRAVERYFRLFSRSAKDLALKPEQSEALDKLHYNYRVELIRLQADLDAAGLGARQSMKLSPPDFGGAKDKVEELSKAFRRMHLAAIETVEKAYGTLDKDQRKQLEEMLTRPD